MFHVRHAELTSVVVLWEESADVELESLLFDPLVSSTGIFDASVAMEKCLKCSKKDIVA